MKRLIKKAVALLLTISMAISVCLVNTSAATVSDYDVGAGLPIEIYLKPASNWFKDSARFAVYFFDSSANYVWDSMKLVENGIYSAKVPGNQYTKLVFCRMNSSKIENDWKNCWNQTTSLEIPTDGKNCYTVAEGTWDKGGGTWSKYTPKQPATYSIMVGDVNKDVYINIKDVTLLQQKLAAAAKYSDTEFVACDSNSDESIDVNDATNIMRYIAEVEGNYGKLGFFYGESGHEIEGNILKKRQI
ncbi:MAG: dockerin type I repeat-containing protein [Ruminococcus sp.]|nr:dockerin type I repeat-containing protein [Ruminococcus sp.]